MKSKMFILGLFLSLSISLAQKLADVTLYLYDGSVLYGQAKMKKDIGVNTPYGKLTIPLRDITQITFGLEKDESIAADINKNIQLLANTSDEKSIQAAEENIQKYGLKSVYYLESFLDKNTSTHSENVSHLLNTVLSTYDLMDYSFSDAVIMSNGDKISGKIDFQTIEFSNSFLKTTIPVGSIKNMEVAYFEGADGNFNFSLKASKYIMANNNGGWFNTGVKVKKGQTIEISARGEIVLASLDNKKYTPDGNVVGAEPTDNNDPTYFNYGTLIFKISVNGKNLKAGSSAKYIADSDGIIYFTIYETVYSEKNTGVYQVKLSIK